MSIDLCSLFLANLIEPVQTAYHIVLLTENLQEQSASGQCRRTLNKTTNELIPINLNFMCEQAKVCKALVQVRLLTRIASQRKDGKAFPVSSFSLDSLRGEK